ncbi:hypothetical protein NNJEOMEG_03907 [Fundidesulfovibrio magnetotacticus]|uniref:ADP-heptose:LPS heptosyltransferase n=1 Tax=Fundidesulfovibrio magnetotacticus TaxID=2730080 RepID=A0A6V8LUF2_9BACT|nr:glycosyltransferase family 9 protein [Fundidesulfovibrio magnetotacticus]GFK96033.1 hypothetical protein NNJEOMEG_03907 [Fundidesulfovibrio magnetotacticus]
MPDKVILIHNGALGDFLLAWPTAWAAARAFAGKRLVWAGSRERLRWLSPMGYEPCTSEERRLLDRLHGADSWPAALEDARVFWPVIRRIPDVPPSSACRFLRAVQGERHVRDAYAADLALAGVPTPKGWLEDFRRLFAAGRNPGRTVLLFPGAGHPLKQWPLVQFFQLADALPGEGFAPLFVLGPAERDEGMDLGGRPYAAPESLEALEALLLGAGAVVGGDTGPMHLAGMLGVPGVSLFGPTRFGQWGPPGMVEVRLALPCAPCTADCSDLRCADAACMAGIAAPPVLESLKRGMPQMGSGFQGPGIP